eukprot:SAG31_NODE_612_length_13548_cov_171.183285_8_plen_88_part_00
MRLVLKHSAPCCYLVLWLQVVVNAFSQVAVQMLQFEREGCKNIVGNECATRATAELFAAEPPWDVATDHRDAIEFAEVCGVAVPKKK